MYRRIRLCILNVHVYITGTCSTNLNIIRTYMYACVQTSMHTVALKDAYARVYKKTHAHVCRHTGYGKEMLSHRCVSESEELTIFLSSKTRSRSSYTISTQT
jgi:hypothetical protein